jgi:hypothetical protein
MDAKTHHWSSWILPKCWSPGKKVIQELPLKLKKKKKKSFHYFTMLSILEKQPSAKNTCHFLKSTLPP